MNLSERYRPKEVVEYGVNMCGLFLDVEMIAEEVDVLDFDIETAPGKQGTDENSEQLYVSTGEQHVEVRVSGFMSRIACEQCNLCKEREFSLQVNTAYIDETAASEVRLRFAEALIETEGMRTMAKNCVNGLGPVI